MNEEIVRLENLIAIIEQLRKDLKDKIRAMQILKYQLLYEEKQNVHR